MCRLRFAAGEEPSLREAPVGLMSAEAEAAASEHLPAPLRSLPRMNSLPAPASCRWAR